MTRTNNRAQTIHNSKHATGVIKVHSMQRIEFETVVVSRKCDGIPTFDRLESFRGLASSVDGAHVMTFWVIASLLILITIVLVVLSACACCVKCTCRVEGNRVSVCSSLRDGPTWTFAWRNCCVRIDEIDGSALFCTNVKLSVIFVCVFAVLMPTSLYLAVEYSNLKETLAVDSYYECSSTSSRSNHSLVATGTTWPVPTCFENRVDSLSMGDVDYGGCNMHVDVWIWITYGLVTLIYLMMWWAINAYRTWQGRRRGLPQREECDPVHCFEPCPTERSIVIRALEFDSVADHECVTPVVKTVSPTLSEGAGVVELTPL